MLSDEAFEDELRLQFSMMEVPVPTSRFVDRAVRHYRHWWLRRRLLIASPAFAVAAAVGIVAGLGGLGPGESNLNPGSASPLGTASLHLARYSFPLPKGYQLTSLETSTCRALVVFTGPPPSGIPRTGAHPYTPPNRAKLYSPSSSTGTSEMAAAAGSDGGCVLMALTIPFTPTQTTSNPYVVGQKVDVDGYVGWLSTTNAPHGLVQLTVQLPMVNGELQDLGIGARGLSAATLLTVVSQGLARSP